MSENVRERMDGIINMHLEIMEIYSGRLLERAKEDAEISAEEMCRNLHNLNAMGNDMQRIKELQSAEPLSRFGV